MKVNMNQAFSPVENANFPSSSSGALNSSGIKLCMNDIILRFRLRVLPPDLTFLYEFEEDLDEGAVFGGVQRVVAAVR